MNVTDELRSSGVDDPPLENARPCVVTGIEGLRACLGADLGVSDWLTIEQSVVNLFAKVTRDEQWIHVDPTRAKNGPYGATIAHGFLTLSLSCRMLRHIVVVEGFDTVINYGLNKVRFPAPLLIGSRVRMHARVIGVRDVAGGVEVIYHVEYETEGHPKPPCVADLVFRYYD